MQNRGEGYIRWCYPSQACLSEFQESTIFPASPVELEDKCAFEPHEIPNAVRNVPSPMCPRAALCVEDGQHMVDIKPNCRYDRRCVGEGREEPVDSQLFSRLKAPEQAPFVWGHLCKQYDVLHPSVADGGVRYLANTWQHLNETWLFTRDISTCGCGDDCQECEFTHPGTSLRDVDESCMQSKGIDITRCRWRITGTTGGVIIFPPDTTGLGLLESGEPQICFAFATIEGIQTASFEDMIGQHPEWRNGI